jgi:hypothetical protein
VCGGSENVPRLTLQCRTWQALLQPTTKGWDNVTSLFTTESLVESLPLLIIAILFTYESQLDNFCALSLCDTETIARQYPPWAMSLPPSANNISLDEVAALQRHGCGDLPLTSDGWFTFKFAAEGIVLEKRPGRFLERVQDFAIPGARVACNIPLADCIWNQTYHGHCHVNGVQTVYALHRSEQRPVYLMSLL